MKPSALSRSLAGRVASFLIRHGLDKPPASLVVGVSGGPDSVCLLHVLSQLRAPMGVTLHAAHLDHRLRGAESEGDAAYVAALCERLDVPLTVESVNIGEYRRRQRLSLEEAARHYRLGFFAAVAQQAGAQAVLLGHTADDQAETVLMHILRGSGVAGLKGMEPLTRWKGRGRQALVLGRPLLESWRRETESYCAEQGLSPRADSSNRSLQFVRNRVRLELMPLLRRLNPKVDVALLRLAESAAAATDFLDAEAARAWKRLVRRTPEGLAIQRGRFLALHPTVAAHLLRRALQGVHGDLQGITSAHIQRMLAIASGPTGKETRLPWGLIFCAGYDVLRLGQALAVPEATARLEGEWTLRVPGTTEIPGWKVSTELAPREPDSGPPRPSGAFAAVMDGNVAQGRLWVRARRPGDRFQPLGMPYAKKLQDFMVDAKIPRALRDQVPLLCDEGGILWVVGCRLGERARMRPDSQAVLRVEFMQAG